jgi:hypothetical protein
MPDQLARDGWSRRRRLRGWRRVFASCRSPSSHEARTARDPAMMQDRYRDFLILVVVVLAVILGAELLIRFQAWDRLQACFTLGRTNCVPPIFLKDLY